MQVDESIFRAYDIRGVYPAQLDEALAEQIARAFAAHLKPAKVVVGRDVRLSGPQLHAAVVKGLQASGVDVVDIGEAGTDEYYYACGRYDLPGIMVTASHNPPEYNGFKMIKQMPEVLLASDLKSKVIEHHYPDSDGTGKVIKHDIRTEFIEHMLKLVPAETIKPLKVVVDTSNGALGGVWQELSKHLPIDLIPLFFEPDGNFPNHGNDVVQPENQQALREKVISEQASLGLIFDPDGDRCLVVDDRGVSVPGDFLTAMMAIQQLKRQPGSTIVYDIRASRVVADLVNAAGGQPLAWKVGHAYIKPKMVEHDAVFGGEVSGHFYFKNYFYSDSGVLAGLTMLQYVSALDSPLSKKVQELESKYFISGEINSTAPDYGRIFSIIKQKYADGEINELDGVSVNYPDWHFTVRASNNEPLIRLTVGADSKELMQKKRDELLNIIRNT